MVRLHAKLANCTLAAVIPHKVLQNLPAGCDGCVDNSSVGAVARNTMRLMVPLSFRRPFRAAIHAFAGLVLAAMATLAWPADGSNGDPGQRLRLTPEQRREMWQTMTPEQREAWRNARSPDDRKRAWQGFSPDQRRDMWQQLSPEQRELMLRRLPPDQRREQWQRMTPEQREAMRQRFIEDRRRRSDPQQGPRPGRQLSPEERQRLREQIEQAQRDVYRRPNKGARK